jgi:hypothetical protein
VLGDSASTGSTDPVAIHEHQLLKRILEAGLRKHRTALLLKRRLCDASRAVR